jgi:alpha,alpha-trehalase
MGPEPRDWSLVYEGYRPEQEGLREALCTLGNGYFATRGAAPDSTDDGTHYPGTYLAGGFNRLVSEVAGRKVENEDLVNMPNWLALTFRIDDGPWFRIDEVEILSFRQELDLRRGVLNRHVRFRDSEGRTTRWNERRIVSMADAHLAGLSVELTAEDWSGRLTVRSGLDGSVINNGVARYRDLASHHLEILELDHLGADALFLRCRTNQSLIQVALAARTRLYSDGNEVEAACQTQVLENRVWHEMTCTVEQGSSVTAEKIVALHTSRDLAISEAGLEAKRTLGHAGRFDALLDAHAIAWRHLWNDCDIDLKDGAAEDTELKLRVHIFHLLQTASPHSIDLDVGIPARGWHGEAYRGHVFWDELFIFPFLSLRIPTLTRALLRYRYRRLGEARRAAREAGYEGAMFPWQSGSNGREETQHLHLNPESGRWNPDNTHRQRHINSAIAYNVWQYHQATDDHEFLYAYGAELFLEIARFWASIATYNAEIDRYEIKGVMGPDEFHTTYPGTDPEAEGGLDNNAYTNVMASWVLTRALDVLDLLPKAHCIQLCERIGLDLSETERWYEISRKLRVPFHDDGIISQFEGYEELEEFDWEGYRKKHGDIHRLDRILEAENDDVNRYKASKQADVLMLFYLFSADELYLIFERLGYPFAPASIPKNIDYYLARTSHGSTLSGVAHSWVLARSDRPRSWRNFQRALDSDILDVQGGTTPEGIHVGAMAGTIDLIQRCYIGIEMRANALHFDPALPDNLHHIKVQLRYRRQVLDIEVNHDTLRIGSRSFTSTPIKVAYRGVYRDLAPGEVCQFRLLRPEERDRDENRTMRAAKEAGHEDASRTGITGQKAGETLDADRHS